MRSGDVYALQNGSAAKIMHYAWALLLPVSDGKVFRKIMMIR